MPNGFDNMNAGVNATPDLGSALATQVPAVQGPAVAGPQLGAPVVPPIAPPPVAPSPVAPDFTAAGRTITQQRLSPEGAKALDKLSGFEKKEQEALSKKMKAAEELGLIEGERAASAQRIMDEQAEKKAIGLAKVESDINESQQRVNRLSDEFASQKNESFWGSKTTGQKIGLAISLAMGAYGSALTGGPNAALQVINGQMKDFTDTKKSKLDQKLKAINNAKASLDQKQKARLQAIEEFNAQQDAAFKKLNLAIEEKKAMAKTQDQIANLEQLQAQIGADAAESRFNMSQSTAATVAEQQVQQVSGTDAVGAGVTDAGKPLSENQGKAVQFLTRAEPAMEAAEKFEETLTEDQLDDVLTAIRIDNVLGAGTDLPIVGEAIEVSRNLMAETTEDIFADIPGGLEYYQNLKEALDALLRDESGAVLSESDIKNKRKALFPVPGDTLSTLEAKRKRRRKELEGLAQRTGQRKSRKLYFEGK